MKLEDEIKQNKPFRAESEKMFVNITYTCNWLNTLFSERLKPYEISPPQYNVLRILRGKYPDTYCNLEITERMLDKSSNATRIVDKLIEKKLVSRSVDKVDRRLVNIKITQKGLAILSEIDQLPPLLSIDEESSRQVNEILDQIRK